MPIHFNSLLRDAGFPLCDVRLVRHKDKRPGCDPYGWWCNDPTEFESYQSSQSVDNRKTFAAMMVAMDDAVGRVIRSWRLSVHWS